MIGNIGSGDAVCFSIPIIPYIVLNGYYKIAHSSGKFHRQWPATIRRHISEVYCGLIIADITERFRSAAATNDGICCR